MKCKEDESVCSHFEHLADIQEQLASMGKIVNNEDYTDTLLALLSASYNYTISLISASAYLSSKRLTTDIFEQFIINEYNRCKISGKDSNGKDEALSVDASKKNQTKDKDKKKPIECFNCHKLGHHRSKCWAKGRGDEGGGPKRSKGTKDDVTQVEDKKEEPEAWAAMVLPSEPVAVAMVAGRSPKPVGHNTTTKLYNSSASWHMSSFRDRFIKYSEIVLHLIQAADKRVFYAIGLGDLKIEVPNGTSSTSIILKDVFHTPNMGLTIVSINRIMKAGYTVKFKNEFCVIRDKAGDQFGSIPANQNGLYKVESIYVVIPLEEHADMAMLHRQLTHISPDAIQKLISSGAIDGIKLINDGSPLICDACEQAKAT